MVFNLADEALAKKLASITNAGAVYNKEMQDVLYGIYKKTERCN